MKRLLITVALAATMVSAQATGPLGHIAIHKDAEVAVPQIGSTPKQVQDALGHPEKVILMETYNGIGSRWIYPNGTVIYFDGKTGRVVEIKN